MKLALKHPITIGTATVAELTLRDHTIAEDYLAFDQRGGVAQRIALIASIAGTDEALVKRLHGTDYQRAEREVDRMLRDDELQADDGKDPAKVLEKNKARGAGGGTGNACDAPTTACCEGPLTARAVCVGHCICSINR